MPWPARRSSRACRWAMPGAATLGLGKRIGGRPAEVVAAEVQARTAEQLFTVLGELKGGAMKFGQAMSVFEAALPEDVAGPYRATLTKLQEAAPPLPASTVHAGARRASSARGWRDRFRDVRRRPGRGRLDRAGAPGGAGPTAARSRSRCSTRAPARRCCPTSTRSAGWAGCSGCWCPASTSSRCSPSSRPGSPRSSTTSSRPTARRAFAEAFDGDPDFLVPRSSTRADQVLVTEWIDGTPLSQVIADGTPASSATAPACCSRASCSSGPAAPGCCTPIPHPGNFRLLDDGRLGRPRLRRGRTGCPTACPRPIGRLLRLALDGDAEGGPRRPARRGVRQGLGATSTPRRCSATWRPFLEPARVDDVPVQPGVAAQPGGPGRRPALAGVSAPGCSSTCRRRTC